ncbi:response regulator [Telluria aromaticivorans]|nr:response regulator [Telluria aromaticivorans]
MMPALSSSLHAAAPQRVLLLDDDRFMLAVLRDMLDGFGPFDVHVEFDARSALAELPRHAPDLVICDLAMPDMDGIEFLQAAAGQGYNGRVIVVSALEDGVRDAATGLARALGLQVTGAFRKPVAAEELRRAVQC